MAERHLDVLGRAQDRDQAERLEHERDRVAADAGRGGLVEAGDLAPSTTTLPASGASSPPRRLSSVVLPLPDRPRTASSSPAGDLEVDPAEGVDHVAARGVVADQRRAPRPSVRRRRCRRPSAGHLRAIIGRIAPVSSGRRLRAPARRRRPRPLAGPVGPDAHVVLLEAEPDAVVQVERVDVRPRQLEPAGPVEHRVLLGDDPVVAAVGLLGPPERLGAGPAVADGHGALDLLGDERVVGHDHDRSSPSSRVDPAQQAEHVARRLRCRARPSARRRGRRRGRWRGPPRSRSAAARRRDSRSGRWVARSLSPTRSSSSSARACRPFRPSRIIGSSTFSAAVRYGSRFRAGLLPDEPDDAPPEPRPLRVRRAGRGRSRRRPPAPRTASPSRRGC